MKATLILLALAGIALIPGLASADEIPCEKPLLDYDWCRYWPSPSYVSACGGLVHKDFVCPI